jgi:nitrate reductase alpha subunit
MNPNGAWQTPDDSESSVYLPVNAISAKFQLYAVDASSSFAAYLTPYNLAIGSSFSTEAQLWIIGYDRGGNMFWLGLDDTRNVRIAGNDDDDNNLSCWIKGYGYSR